MAVIAMAVIPMAEFFASIAKHPRLVAAGIVIVLVAIVLSWSYG